MSAAEDLLRQVLALPEDDRRVLVAKVVASLPEDDGAELDPAEVAAARRELDEHRRDPSTSLEEPAVRAHVAERWGVR